MNDADLLEALVLAVRGHRGLRRKRGIESVLPLFSKHWPSVLADRGEDGAVLRVGAERMVLAADGIMEELVDCNPRWAGYCSILVNFNDILSMGGTPVAAVNVISSRDGETLGQIVSGMTDASERFGVPIVGGHLHPDASSNSISVAMLGLLESEPILSSSASTGDKVLVITDLRGSYTPGIPYSWDCTSALSSDEIVTNVRFLRRALSHFSSAKDISNPGLMGTLAMLLEASRRGARIRVEKIPYPEEGGLLQWVTAYQGFGFVGTAPDERIAGVRTALRGSGLTFAVMGEVVDNPKLTLGLGAKEKVLLDLSKERVTGLFPDNEGC